MFLLQSHSWSYTWIWNRSKESKISPSHTPQISNIFLQALRIYTHWGTRTLMSQGHIVYIILESVSSHTMLSSFASYWPHNIPLFICCAMHTFSFLEHCTLFKMALSCLFIFVYIWTSSCLWRPERFSGKWWNCSKVWRMEWWKQKHQRQGIFRAL